MCTAFPGTGSGERFGQNATAIRDARNTRISARPVRPAVHPGAEAFEPAEGTMTLDDHNFDTRIELMSPDPL